MKHPFARATLAALTLALACGVPAADKKADTSKVSGSDKHFLTEAAQGGLMEVELGKLAQQNGASDQIKQFGQRMVDDHSKANQELESVAGKLGVTLPKDPGKKHSADIKKFSKLTGDKFDREYAKNMVKDHEQDVSLFRKESQKANSADLKQFAANTLPTLEEHLKMARALPGQQKKK